MAENRKYDVFLSYANEDRLWVDEFSSALRRAGVNDWFDAHQLRPGEHLQQAVEQALRASKVLVLMVSPHRFRSPWTYFELGAAVADHKRIIPVIVSDIDWSELPPLVRQLQFVREKSATQAAKVVAEAIPEIVGSN